MRETILQSDHPFVVDQLPSDELAALRARLSQSEDQTRKLQAALAAAAAREQELAHELQHRVRNMLGVVRSIFRRSRESGASPSEFAEHFEGRLNAVARYQSVIAGMGSVQIDLEDMIRDELLDVPGFDEASLTIEGPPVRLSQKSAELMGLAMHELTTNSIKFGALLHEGKLTITWSIAAGAPDDILQFRWKEDAVAPLTTAPRPSGFGRELIEEALPYEIGATTSFVLKPGGIDCSIDLPLTDRSPDHSVGLAEGAWSSPPALEANR